MKPKEKTPSLEVKLINDTNWSLQKQEANKYTLIVFYRGLHCPVCKKQLEEVKNNLEALTERGIHVIAISMDTEKRAKISGKEWDVNELPIGFNLSKEKAQEWGLYLSEAITDKEPKLFSEPGLFLVKADGTLYFSSVQTMPFARPKIKDIIKAVDFIEDKDYPARGEY
jgi:peroxiredoxin